MSRGNKGPSSWTNAAAASGFTLPDLPLPVRDSQIIPLTPSVGVGVRPLPPAAQEPRSGIVTTAVSMLISAALAVALTLAGYQGLQWVTSGALRDMLEPWSSRSAAVKATPEPSYTVRPGDSLAGIAKQVMGDYRHWSVIYEANRSVLASPSHLEPGMMLIIPGLETAK